MKIIKIFFAWLFIVFILLIVIAVMSGPPPRNISGQPQASITAEQRPTSAAAPSSQAQQTCFNDWTKCQDNAELINNYVPARRISGACKSAADEMARFGTPVWPSFWDRRAFSRFLSGNEYVTSGIAVVFEQDAQFQNGYGAMVRSQVRCEYNLRTNAVIDIVISPR